MDGLTLTAPAWTIEPWLLDDSDPLERRRRAFWGSVAVSVAAHLAILALIVFAPPEKPLEPSTAPPLAVRIVPARPVERPTPPAEPSAAPVPQVQPRANILTVPRSQHPSRSIPVRPTNPTPLPPSLPAPPPSTVQPPDMMAAVAAARARRQATDEAIAEENAREAAQSQGPSEGDARMANINRNLQWAADKGKTSGVFTIQSMGVRVGSFRFRGWTDDPNNAYRQSYEVDAGPGGDLQLAMVRKMIEVIRTHYKGDFNWESSRLGRVVVQSARPEDQAGLEEFLMKEFFGAPPH